MYQAVLFDLDGLLVDTEVLIEAAWREAMGELGFELTHEMFLPYFGAHPSTMAETLNRQYGLDLPGFDRLYLRRTEILVEFYRTRLGPQHLKPGAANLLQQLAGHNIPRALATISRRPVVELVLERTGIAKWLPERVCGGEVANPKPAPDIYLEAARRLCANPEGCIVLEDSASGITAGHRAGMYGILVPDVVQPTPEVAALARAIYPSLVDAGEEVIRLLGI